MAMTDRLAPDVIALDPRLGPLAEATQRIEQLPLDGLLTYLIETVPAAYLPELARQFHIGPMEGWQFVAGDQERRRLIREAIALHRKKGTPWAVRRALAQLGIEADIIEPDRQRQIYAEFGPLLVDGTWRLDGSRVIRPVERLAGVPQLQHWATFFVRINLAMARSYDMTLLRQAVREWAPVSRHPILLEWLEIEAIERTLSDYRLLLSKRICSPYVWPGEQLHGCPHRAWTLGRDGEPVRLPAAFGSFRVGERRGYVAGRLLAARRAQGHQEVHKRVSAWAWRRETLPPDPQPVITPPVRLIDRPRRLDGSWRLSHARFGQPFGFRLAHASFRERMRFGEFRLGEHVEIPPARLHLSGAWRLGQARAPLFEMRSIYV
jgi:phage tail P2-like protein